MYNVWSRNVWDFEKAPWRDFPRMNLSAEILLEGGRTVRLRSDASFRCATGPILSDSLYDGEVYDARLEAPGWDAPGFDDAAWTPAVRCRAPGGILRPMEMPPVRVVRRLPPLSRTEIRPGTWILDFGENLVGWAALRVAAAAGTEVRLVFGERLGADGDLDRSGIDGLGDRDHFQTDAYVCRGGAEEAWEPRFTYHGFQYVRLTGYPGTPPDDAVVACEAHTDLPARGTLSTSDATLSWIHEATLRSSLGNYVGMPTDCPHREKNGWTGDAALSAEQLLLNFDPTRAYRKWLRDLVDCQRADGSLPGIAPTGGWGFHWGNGPAWDCALVLIPWYVHLYDGDSSLIDEFYEPIRRYVDYATRMADDGIVDFGLGDWCPPVGQCHEHKCPTRVTDTAIHATNQRTLAAIARALGRTGDAERYGAAADATADAFRRAFVDRATGSVESDCQTAYACALHHGLVDGETAVKVFARLVAEVERCGRHIDCGILGAKYVPRVLTDGGRADLAYAIATNPTFPGWGHWRAQGATTLWETWDGNLSRNHHMFSDIDGWQYSGLAGIRPDPLRPGFRHTVFRPSPVAAVERLEASHLSPLGRVACGWRRDGGRLRILAEVPDGATGTLHLPKGLARNAVDLELKGSISVAGET